MTKFQQSRSCSRVVVGLCAALGMHGALADEQSATVSASLTLGSDVLFRGVSQSLGGAAAQAAIDVEFESGVYGYVWASNVDFVPDGEPDDGARVEIDAALGYTRELNDQLRAAFHRKTATRPPPR